jgi:glutamate synthase domain-containing protein 1
LLQLRCFNLLIVLTLVIFLQSTIAAAQTTSEDVSKKATEVWDTLKAYGAEKKQEAVTYGNGLLKEADSKLTQLEEKSAKISGEAKTQYEKEMKDLKSGREHAATKLEEMKKASASAWDSTKKGFADAYKALQQAYAKAAGRFK